MKLTRNSVSIVENIVDFICTLTFKDEVAAFKTETQESAISASIYLSAYLKTDQYNTEQRETIIARYTELNPYYKKLEVDYGIKPHVSRLAKDLDIISHSEKMIINNPYLHNYRTIYKNCLQSFYTTAYSTAMVNKENYREFCLLAVNLTTFLQLTNKWLENPYDINLMAESQVDKFMNSFGISFFANFPLRYKQVIARNLNKLIINKGTDQIIIDVLELFGFSKVAISKYYLIREAVSVVDTINGTTDFRETNDYDVYFLSHDISLPSLNYAVQKDLYNKFTYEKVVNSDEQWKVTKDEVKSLDFNFVETKYFSIETGFNVNAEIANTTLVLNLLKTIRTSYPTKDKMDIFSNFISENASSKLEDIIITLQVLMCEYYDRPDTIDYGLVGKYKSLEFAKYDPINVNAKLLKEFPNIQFETDIQLEDMREYEEFNRNAISNITNQNNKIRSYLELLIHNETDYQAYKKLRAAHHAKFFQPINYDMFEGHDTLTSYLMRNNVNLYALIQEIRETSEVINKRKLIQIAIDKLTDIITSALSDFNIFLSASSVDILVSYMKKVITVFKSFTTTLLDLNVFIVMTERNETKLLDKLGDFRSEVSFDADMRLHDDFKFRNSITQESNIFLNDRIVITQVEYP